MPDVLPPSPPAARRRPHRAWAVAGVVAAVLVGAAGVCEALGWPFLAGPVERTLSTRLARDVDLRALHDQRPGRLRIHLLGGLRIHADALMLGGPAWRPATPTLNAQGVDLALRYRDLWALRQGHGLRVKALRADRVDAMLERLADGRASWQLGTGSHHEPPGRRPGVLFDELVVSRGIVVLRDAPSQLDAEVTFALRDGGAGPSRAAGEAGTTDTRQGLQAQARGQYRDAQLSATLESDSPLPWISGQADAPPVAVKLQAHAGATRLDFDGAVRDLAGLGLQGRYRVSGPSLAAIGEPFGVVLPTTPAFTVRGHVSHERPRWVTQVEDARIGQSRLRGAFAFTPATARGGTPLLTGELAGSALWLADLGPAVGTMPDDASSTTPPAQRPKDGKGGKVLPDRRFDLPSLRAMDADVRVGIDNLHLGAAFAEPIAPLRGHLQLQQGVLRLDELDARTAEGRIDGNVALDGRGGRAAWDAQLRWADVRLERWLKLSRSNNQPPYATGRIAGRLALQGEGRSTAEILATTRGQAALLWSQGTVSHLVVEGMGLDVAQALGVLFKGDDALPVQCGAADLAVQAGVVTPRLLMVDTRDSTVWIEGSASLATEALDLRLHASPKDMSPLALRTPVRLQGTLGAPDVSLEKGPLARRLVPAALLALVNPLAALLPLVDTGSQDEANAAAAGCRNVLARARQAPGVAGR